MRSASHRRLIGLLIGEHRLRERRPRGTRRSERADRTHYDVTRRSALANSLAIHNAIALVVAIIMRAPSPDRSEPPPRTIEIELVGPSPTPPSPQSPANTSDAAPASAPTPHPPQRERSTSPKRPDPSAQSSQTRA